MKQSYYLEPEPVGRKAFQLLKTVLADSELQAVCKIVLKDREQLAALDPFGPTMLLSTLYWPDEVRDVADLDIPEEEAEFKPAEVEMARQLVDALSGDFDAEPLQGRVSRGTAGGHRQQGRRPAGRGARSGARDQQADRPHGRARGQRRGGPERGYGREPEAQTDRGRARSRSRRRARRAPARSRPQAKAKGKSAPRPKTGAKAETTAARARRKTA